MNNISSYIIINRQTKHLIKFYIYISLIVFVSLILILNIKYKKYFQTKAIVINDNVNYNLNIYLSPNKINIIKSNNSIIIEDKEYNYKIKSISKDYILSNDFNNYIEIILEVNLKEEDKINNNILEVKLIENDQKLFYYLKDYLKEGV